MAPIAVGDTIPDGVLSYLDEDNTSQKFHVHEELKGKKVVLLAVPGAFTPTCRYLSLRVSLSLSLFGGYLGGLVWEGRVFSWVVVAWIGDLKEILDFVYFWSSSSNVEECGFSWVLDVFLGRCVSAVSRSLCQEPPCEGEFGWVFVEGGVL